VAKDKRAYVGKAALEAQLAQGFRRKFVSLVIDSAMAPAHPGDSMLAGDTVVGTVTSAAYGFRTSENLAMGFVRPEHAGVGTELDVLVLGERLPARVVEQCRYDPTYQRVRC
jgi:dimethylglycine dehydrogenase